MKKPKRRLVLINVLVFIAMFILVEGVISILMVTGRHVEEYLPVPSGYSGYSAFLLLPMYKDSPQAAEYWREFTVSAKFEYVDYLVWRRKDYTGKYINVLNGRRLTPTNVRRDGPMVAVFGGSALWGTGVKDSETIPSWMARRVANDFRVENFGNLGYVAFQDFLRFYELLQDHQLIRHAVFYDGANDAYASCVSPGKNRATLDYYQMKGKVEYRKGSDLRLAELAQFVASYLPRRHATMHYRCDDESEASEAALAMVKIWKTIEDVAEKSGVKAYFFLQPVSFVSDSDVSYLQIDETVTRSFRNFYKYVDIQARRAGLHRYYNLSDILSGRTGRYFIDYSHITSEANGIIANAIVERIKPL